MSKKTVKKDKKGRYTKEQLTKQLKEVGSVAALAQLLKRHPSSVRAALKR